MMFSFSKEEPRNCFSTPRVYWCPRYSADFNWFTSVLSKRN